VGFDIAKNTASAFSRPRYTGHGPAVKFFALPEFSQEIKIYSCSGVLLRTLAVSAGAAAWDCTDAKGNKARRGRVLRRGFGRRGNISDISAVATVKGARNFEGKT